MIPFFRKIRKKMADDNRPLKYMRYAIGEIVLVVIGILIALQINNWNEERKLVIEEKDIYKNIITDLRRDAVLIDNAVKFAKSQQKVHYQIYHEIIDDSLHNTDMDYDLIIFPYSFHSHIETNHLGVSRDLKDAEAAENINAYFRQLGEYKTSLDEHNSDIKNEIVNFFSRNGVFNLENAYTQDRVYDYSSKNQILNHDKLIALKDNSYFQGFLVNLRMWTAKLIMDGEKLVKLNNELITLLENRK